MILIQMCLTKRNYSQLSVLDNMNQLNKSCDVLCSTNLLAVEDEVSFSVLMKTFSVLRRRNKEVNCVWSNEGLSFRTMWRRIVSNFGQKCENKCSGEFAFQNVIFCHKRPIISFFRLSLYSNTKLNHTYILFKLHWWSRN